MGTSGRRNHGLEWFWCSDGSGGFVASKALVSFVPLVEFALFPLVPMLPFVEKVLLFH